MKTKELLENINNCIDRYHERKNRGSKWRLQADHKKEHIKTDYPELDRRFVQDFHIALRKYIEGDYYQSILKAKEIHARSYARRKEERENNE